MTLRETLNLTIAISAVVLAGVYSANSGNAQSVGGPAFDVTSFTIDSGGGTSTDGTFAISGTIGQPDAYVMAGGTFQLAGGFWTGAGPAPTPARPILSLPEAMALSILTISLR